MTIKEIIDVSSLKVSPDTDLNVVIKSIATLHDAKENDLSFFHNIKYKDVLGFFSIHIIFLLKKDFPIG